MSNQHDESRDLEEVHVEPAPSGHEGELNSETPVEKSSDKVEDSESDEPPKKTQNIFEVETEPYSYELDKKMAEYANRQMDVFQPNNTLIEHIMTKNPIPSNIKKKAKELDTFLKELLTDQGKRYPSTEIESWTIYINKLALSMVPYARCGKQLTLKQRMK